MKLGNKDFDQSIGEKKLYYISIIGAIWFLYSFIAKGISSSGVVFNGLIGFICMLVVFFGERKRLKAIQGFKDTSDVKEEQLTYTLSEKDDEGKRVLCFQNNSSYPVVDFCVEGISQSLKKTVGYRINSIVLPNKTVQNRVDNSPDDIEIYKIKFTYLAENNSNVSVEYDLNLDSYKINSGYQLKRPSKFRNLYNRLILTWFAFSLLFAFTSTVTGANDYVDTSEKSSTSFSISNLFHPREPVVKVTDIPLDTENLNAALDSELNSWVYMSFINNSDRPIVRYQITMINEQGIKSYLKCDQLVSPGESSPTMKGLLYKKMDRNVRESPDFIDIKYTYKNAIGRKIDVIYDPRTKEHRFQHWEFTEQAY